MTAVYWRADVPAEPATERHPVPSHVDVAVIGAGFAGLSIALDLLRTEPALRVALIEADSVGHGASGRNAGLLLPLAVFPWLLPGTAGSHDPRGAQRLLHERVVAHARQLSQEHAAAEVRPARVAMIASNRFMAAGLGWVGDALDATGIAADHWPAEQVAETCGAPARGALVLDAWTIHPAKLAAVLATRFVAAGGTLHEHTRVHTVTPTRTNVEIHTGDGQVRADHAVICTGPFTGMLAAPDPPRARPVQTYMRASTRLPEPTTTALGGDGLFLSAPGARAWRTGAPTTGVYCSAAWTWRPHTRRSRRRATTRTSSAGPAAEPPTTHGSTHPSRPPRGAAPCT